MRECSTCGSTELPYADKRLCRACNNLKQKNYRKANPERFKAYHRKQHAKKRTNADFVEAERQRGRGYWHKKRRTALDAYGAVCNCCGETEELFLTFDHVNNDGASHRRELGYDGNGKGASSATLSWIVKNDFPDSIQVLCMNCNLGKQRNNGVCPHQPDYIDAVNSGEAQTG